MLRKIEKQISLIFGIGLPVVKGLSEKFMVLLNILLFYNNIYLYSIHICCFTCASDMLHFFLS
jgi:hypothetical protein